MCKEDIKSLCKKMMSYKKNLKIAKLKGERSRAATFHKNKSKELAIAAKNDVDAKMHLLEEKLMSKIYKLESQYSDVKNSLDESEIERSERLLELESTLVTKKSHKQLYKDNVRQCCMELMSFNVGIRQVEPVIKSVLHNLTSLEVNEIPKLSTLVSMLPEMKALIYKQLGEELTECSNLTLHSDGASKFGQHYQGFQVSGSYSLGLSKISTGSADEALQTLKIILEDINLVASDSTGQNVYIGLY